MEKDILDIVKEKRFIELTIDEREELKDLCDSEDQYNQLQHVLLGVDAMKVPTIKPKAETKQRLDSLFAETYPKTAPVWYNGALTAIVPKDKPLYRQPLVQVAAVGLLALLVVPFFNNTITGEDNRVAAIDQQEKNILEQESDAGGSVAESEDVSTTEETTVDSDTDLRTSGGDFVADLTVEMTENTGDRGAGSSTLLGGTSPEPTSSHPDGVFIGEAAVSYSVSANEEPEMLDLLTTSF